MPKTSYARIVWGVVVLTCAGSCCFAADAPALKYSFKPDQTYTYHVTIEAQTPEYVETFSGESVYKVKAVDAVSGQMSLVHSATLASQRKTKEAQRPGPPMRLG